MEMKWFLFETIWDIWLDDFSLYKWARDYHSPIQDNPILRKYIKIYDENFNEFHEIIYSQLKRNTIIDKGILIGCCA